MFKRLFTAAKNAVKEEIKMEVSEKANDIAVEQIEEKVHEAATSVRDKWVEATPYIATAALVIAIFAATRKPMVVVTR